MLDVYGCDYPMHVIMRPLNMGGLLAFMECVGAVDHSLTACLHWLAAAFLVVFMIHSCQSLPLSPQLKSMVCSSQMKTPPRGAGWRPVGPWNTTISNLG